MQTILITGTSGLIGGALAKELTSDYRILALSRKMTTVDGVIAIKGDFANRGDLSGLDKYEINIAIHLGAVTGGCSEHDGIMVNVEGTRVLSQYLAARGCKKMIFASSIATIGIHDPHFIPDHLPITEDHRCKDKYGYGLSKYMMEELLAYLNRQHHELDIIALRLCSVNLNENVPGLIPKRIPWFLAQITHMVLNDAVNLFRLAAEASYEPGLRIINGVCSKSWSREPVVKQLRCWWGDRIDLSYFEKPENRFASVYNSQKAEEILGFKATNTLELLQALQG